MQLFGVVFFHFSSDMGNYASDLQKMADSPQLILLLIKDPGKKFALQEAEDMFRIYDKNKDGFISFDELKEVLSELDVNFTDIEIKEMMDTFDTDGDGQINFEEYQAMRTLMDQRFVINSLIRTTKILGDSLFNQISF